MTGTQDSWPAGATWVFEGTVAEDATGGTHICSLTVSPGSGNEIQVLYGFIKVGATATSQTASVSITDGTNPLFYFMNPAGGTTSGALWSFPSNQTAMASTGFTPGYPSIGIVSGSMTLVLSVLTAAISVTQTFGLVCRIKGAMPTATLADSVGTPVLTTNTNKVF